MRQFIEEESVRLEEEESLEVFDGSVVDVKFLGKTGQSQWALENFEFYVIIPEVSVTMFCLDKNVRPITIEELRDLLLITLQNTSIVQPTLFYKGEAVDGKKELKTFPDKSAFILAGGNFQLKHSGKLFTCECQDCTDENNLLIGFAFGFNFKSIHIKRSKCKCNHPLYMGSIMANGK